MGVKLISQPFMIGAAVTAAAAGLSGYVWHEQHRPPVLEVYFFSLKSGRSIFVRTPEDKRILIDGGADSSVIRELTGILPFYSRRIDTLISTGTDGKNVSGLISVLERFSVDQAFIPSVTPESLGLASSTDLIYSTFTNMLHAKNISVHEVIAGDRIDFDSKVSAQVLFPAPADAFAYSNASSPELLLSISYASTSVLLLGDATKKIQKYITSRASSTDVVSVSHGADPSDMSPELMGAFQPQFLIYSKTIAKAPVKTAEVSKTVHSSQVISPASKDKVPVDPLADIPDENGFNLKEKGSVKAVSDGRELKVSQ